MSVEMELTYEGDLHCTAVHGPSKSILTTDAPVDNGGKGAAFSPTDLVAVATGTCILTVMGLVARRENVDIKGVRIHAVKEMASTPTRRIASIALKVTFPKDLKLTDEQRKKLEHAAHACPVKKALNPDVQVVLDFVYV